MIMDFVFRHLMRVDCDDIIFLTDLKTRKILEHNNTLLNLFNYPVIDKTLNELIKSSKNSLTIAELRYCDFVEVECIKRGKCSISLEQFHGTMYLCIRLLCAGFGNEMKILTIIKTLDTKELVPNQVCFF